MKWIRGHCNRRWSVAEEDRGFVTPCLIWMGSRNGQGYGTVIRDRKTHMAHRFSWESANGPIPEGLQLDHLCRVPSCVNPEHLEPVTNAENVRRGAAARPKVTHCQRGHEFTPGNTGVSARGTRFCRACKSADNIARGRKRWGGSRSV